MTAIMANIYGALNIFCQTVLSALFVLTELILTNLSQLDSSIPFSQQSNLLLLLLLPLTVALLIVSRLEENIFLTVSRVKDGAGAGLGQR